MSLRFSMLLIITFFALKSEAQHSIYNQLNIAYTTPNDLELYPRNGKTIDKIIIADFDSIGTKFRLKNVEVIQFEGNRIRSQKTNFHEPDPNPDFQFEAYNTALSYDKQNRLIAINTTQAKNGQKVSKEVIQHDANKRPISLMTYEANKFFGKSLFVYQNNQITLTSFDENNKPEGTTRFKLNSAKQIIRTEYSSGDYTSNTDYTYTSLNLAGRKLFKVKTEKDIEQKRGFTKTYNTTGDIIRSKYSQTVGMGLIGDTYIYDYKYGRNGLWLERFKVKKGHGTFGNSKLKYTRRMIFYTDGTSEGDFNYYFSDYIKTKWGKKVKIDLPLDKYKYRTTSTTSSTPVKTKTVASSSSQDQQIDSLVNYYTKLLKAKDLDTKSRITYLTELSYKKIQNDNSIRDKSAYIAAFMEKLHSQDPAKKLLFSFMMKASPLKGWKAGLDKTSPQTRAEVKKSAQDLMNGYNKHIQKINKQNKR